MSSPRPAKRARAEPVLLGCLELEVLIRRELVHLKSWPELLGLLPRPRFFGGPIQFGPLFVQFEYFGGRARGAVAPASPADAATLSRVGTIGDSQQVTPPGEMGSAAPLQAQVRLTETSPRRAVARVELYLSPQVLAGELSCQLDCGLLAAIWPDEPEICGWAERVRKIRAALDPAAGAQRLLQLIESTDEPEQVADPAGLQCRLFGYQRQTLGWMLAQVPPPARGPRPGHRRKSRAD